MSKALELVRWQAEDEVLWFAAETIMEDYLQRALRDLHAAVEHDAESQELGHCVYDNPISMRREAWQSGKLICDVDSILLLPSQAGNWQYLPSMLRFGRWKNGKLHYGEFSAMSDSANLRLQVTELEQENDRLRGVIDNHLDHIHELERQLGEKTPDIGFEPPIEPNMREHALGKSDEVEKQRKKFEEEKENASRPAVFLDGQLHPLESSLSRQEIALRFAVAGYEATCKDSPIEERKFKTNVAADAYTMADAFLAARKKK